MNRNRVEALVEALRVLRSKKLRADGTSVETELAEIESQLEEELVKNEDEIHVDAARLAQILDVLGKFADTLLKGYELYERLFRN
jgi:hypothetical protein